MIGAFVRQRAAYAVLLLLFAVCVTMPAPAEPILFVTQTPFSLGDPGIGMPFGSHQGLANLAPRGGDLYIRYDDGTVRNLTGPAGYGTTMGQEITVRDPCVHWSSTKALFSMVIGGTTQGNLTPVYFQIYEITGILEAQTAVITKLPQPSTYNNVSPIYAQDDSILFTTDRPRNGDTRFYPLIDEYRGQASNTGLWQMNADGSNLHILDPCPSGDFAPSIDSFGRIIMTRWDHLERDQQADTDISSIIQTSPTVYGSNTYNSETDFTSHSLTPGDEIFPQTNLHPGNAVVPDPTWDFQRESDEFNFEFNHLFPWAMNPDGTELEVINHVGRHELNNFVRGERTSLPDMGSIFVDANVVPRINSFQTPRESSANPGYFYGVSGAEFFTHGAGQIVALYAPLGLNAAYIKPEYITHFENSNPTADNATTNAYYTGMYRDPFTRADGTVWAVHTSEYRKDSPATAIPSSPSTTYTLTSRYDFQIKQLTTGTAVSPTFVAGPNGGTITNPNRQTAGSPLLSSRISKTISYFDNVPNRPMAYSGPLWEMQPQSVVARAIPPSPTTPLPSQEDTIAQSVLGGSPGVAAFRSWLTSNSLAVIVSRDVTVRADQQQDFNLKVKWSLHTTPSTSTSPKEIAYLQLVEGDYVRGRDTVPGRRVIARPIPSSINPPLAGAPAGAVKLGDDGSMAAFVPARRALSWQTTDTSGVASARERYWITFQPGEIRSCKNCHGINLVDVFGNPPPTNSPQAFTDLLNWYKSQTQTAVVFSWYLYD